MYAYCTRVLCVYCTKPKEGGFCPANRSFTVRCHDACGLEHENPQGQNTRIIGNGTHPILTCPGGGRGLQWLCYCIASSAVTSGTFVFPRALRAAQWDGDQYITRRLHAKRPRLGHGWHR